MSLLCCCFLVPGCYKLQMVRSFDPRTRRPYCVTIPSDAAIASSSWDNLIVIHTSCDTNNLQQCLQVDGDITASARIMYKGLCVGAKEDAQPLGPTQSTSSVRLMPCTEGLVYWRQPTPGGLITLHVPGCDSSDPPSQCFMAMSIKMPLAYEQVWLLDVRTTTGIGYNSFVTGGRASYSVVQQSPGEQGPGVVESSDVCLGMLWVHPHGVALRTGHGARLGVTSAQRWRLRALRDTPQAAALRIKSPRGFCFSAKPFALLLLKVLPLPVLLCSVELLHSPEEALGGQL